MKQRAEQNQSIASPILPNSAPAPKKQAEKHKEPVAPATASASAAAAPVAPWNEKASPVNKSSGKATESLSLAEIQKQEQEKAAAAHKQKVLEQQQRGLKVMLM